MKKIKITISGMHCSSCANNVERSVKKIPGIKSCSVSVLTNKGIIEADDKVSDEDMKKAVARAGYKLLAIEQG